MLFLATSLFFGSCSKDYYEDDPLPQNSQIEDANPTTKSTYSWGGHNCSGCGLCITPNCYMCTETCICTCRNARCPVCKGCLAARTRSFYCTVCTCKFSPQTGELDCFITSMLYAATLTGGPRISREEIVKLFPGVDFDNGVPTKQVPIIMDKVFGYQYYNSPNPGWSFTHKDLLDKNAVIITNYLVKPGFAHAVVVVGYVEDESGIWYTCLDPGTGNYTYKTDNDLLWLYHSDKFTVVVEINN